jgi:hypothetical protein
LGGGGNGNAHCARVEDTDCFFLHLICFPFMWVSLY